MVDNSGGRRRGRPAKTREAVSDTSEESLEDEVEAEVEVGAEDDVNDAQSLDDLSEDEILAATPQELSQNPDLATRWTRIANDTHMRMHRQAEALKEKMHALARKINLVDKIRRKQRTKGDIRKGNAQAVREYLSTQNALRREKAAKATAFIEANTNPADVAAALDNKSQLDKAMSERKPQRGSTRPLGR